MLRHEVSLWFSFQGSPLLREMRDGTEAGRAWQNSWILEEVPC